MAGEGYYQYIAVGGKVRKEIDVELVKRLLDYDASRGILIWRARPLSMFQSDRIGKGWNTKHEGANATTKGAGGYLYVCIFNVRYLAHRIAWAIHFSENPPAVLDHVDRDRLNFKIENLRHVSDRENAMNQSLRSDNKSGISGIWDKKPKSWGARWMVVIGEGGGIGYTKTHKCFGLAMADRNKQYRKRGFCADHGIRK